MDPWADVDVVWNWNHLVETLLMGVLIVGALQRVLTVVRVIRAIVYRALNGIRVRRGKAAMVPPPWDRDFDLRV
jgi:hypothetical protein